MKRLRPQYLQHSHRRRGSLFHYYMMYLFLTSVLLASAGVCLHSALKADRLDLDESLRIRTLQRLERQLRSDAADGILQNLAEAELSMSGADAATIRWRIEDHRITRELTDEEQLLGSERFVFPSRTVMKFSNEAGGIIAFVVTDPPRAMDAAEQESSPIPQIRLLLGLKSAKVSGKAESGEEADASDDNAPEEDAA